MSAAGQAGQVATVAVLAALFLYCLWRGYQAEHPKGPRVGDAQIWDDPDWQTLHNLASENPAERVNAQTGPVKHQES